EHAGEERPVVVDPQPHPLRPFGMAVPGGDDAEHVDEALQILRREGQLVEEDGDVHRNDRPRHDGGAAMRDGVADGDQARVPGLRCAVTPAADPCKGASERRARAAIAAGTYVRARGTGLRRWSGRLHRRRAARSRWSTTTDG